MKCSYLVDDGMGWAILMAWDGYWEIDTLAVHPACRRKGLGNELMRQICDDADRADTELRLWCAGTKAAMDDAQLLRWYRKFGFDFGIQNKPLLIRPARSRRTDQR